ANVKSDLSQTYEQYNIKVDQNKASNYGLSASQLAMTLNQNTPEQSVTTVKKNGKSIDVKIKEDKETDRTEEKHKNTNIQTATGQAIEVSDSAKVEKTTAPNKEETKAGDHAPKVAGKVTNDDAGGTAQEVLSELDEIATPNNVDVNMGGANEHIGN